MNKKNKKYKNYLIIFCFILIVILSITRFTYIFGSKTDWSNQHILFPEYFREIFYKTGKLIPNFSLNYGGGQNVYNLSYYGLLSPLILPSYLLPFVKMSVYISVINILIIIISSVLFYKLLIKHEFNPTISLITTIIFTLAGPFLYQFHRQIMFVNYMPFLILSFYGVDKYLEENKKCFLIINIFLMIMTSYYFSVSGILTICLYYLYRYLYLNKQFIVKDFIKKTTNLIICILIAIAMSGILIIPTAHTLFAETGRKENNLTLINLLIPNLNWKIFNNKFSIGLSAIGLISFLYLPFTKRKENITIFSIITLILTIPLFSYILNGTLYIKEKCFIPFIPLFGYFIAYFLKNLFNNKIEISKFFNYTFLTVLIMLIIDNNNYKKYILPILLIFLIKIYNKYKKPEIIYIPVLLTALILCIKINLNDTLLTTKEFNNIFDKDIDLAIKKAIDNDDDFYRMNNIDNLTHTANKIYDSKYYTTNIYSSKYNNKYLNFIRNIFPDNIPFQNYFFHSPTKNILLNSYMGTKYIYSSIDPGIGYTKIDKNIYKNENSLPIIYGTSNTYNIDSINSNYPYNIDILLNNAIINNEKDNPKITNTIEEIDLKYDIIESNNIEIQKLSNKYILKVKKNEGNLKIKLNTTLHDKLLFLNIYGLEENNIPLNMTINNIRNELTAKNSIYNNKNTTFHFLINDQNLNTLNINLTKGTYTITNIKTYTMDYDELPNIKNNKNKIEIKKINDNKIIGTINQLEDGYLITSIPYDPGFEIYIDNTRVEKEIVNYAFLGSKLEKGTHNIEIIYNTPGLKTAKVITIIGIILFTIIFIKERINNEKTDNKIPRNN